VITWPFIVGLSTRDCPMVHPYLFGFWSPIQSKP
jgi:hypothetical protein